jgi:ElaB/YqjD/DUF883 family membrane-anchored ribosome-binding protein
MRDRTNSARDSAVSARSGVEEQGKEAMEQARDKAAEIGRKSQEQVDAGIDRAAEGVDTMAEKLRERGASGTGVTAEASTKLADGMERTATYLREHDSEDILDDVERYVRDHPMQAVAGALVGGFVLARLLR